MKIYTMCVDAERGRYMAISTIDPSIKVIAGSEMEAVGNLVKQHATVVIEAVIHIDTDYPKL